MSDVPCDLDAEKALLGALIALPERIPDACRIVATTDFYSPAHQATFEALVALHSSGQQVSERAVLSAVQKAGVPMQAADVIGMVATVSVGWKAAAETVCDRAERRHVLAVAREAAKQAVDLAVDPWDAASTASVRLAELNRPVDDAPADLVTLDEVADEDPEQTAPWVIPDLLRVGWRAVIVAGEGAGKSWITSQMAVAAAQGVHPWTPTVRFQPCRALIADYENPRDALQTRFRSLRGYARELVGDTYDPSRMRLLHREGGVELRGRRDKSELEAAIAAHRPQIVCAGPVYKMFLKGHREMEEDAVRELIAVLDDLRTRYGFALVLEHHVPQGDDNRSMRPIGTSLWRRWPEVGIGLPSEDGGRRLAVEDWRGKRVASKWPLRFDREIRGRRWPWHADFGEAA